MQSSTDEVPQDDPPPQPPPLTVLDADGTSEQDVYMLSGKGVRLYMPDELPPELCFGKHPEDAVPTALAAPRGLKGLFSDSTVAYQPLDVVSLPAGSVLLNVYDVGDAELFQKINRVSTMNDTVLIGGVYHAGVEVYGVEWSYGFSEDEDAGVSRCMPRTHPQHTYRATVNMGRTELPRAEVEDALLRLTDRWRGHEYSLIHHNCLDFCNAFCKELGVGRIPGWVDRFGRTASSIDNLSRLTADSISRTKQLARTVSTDLDHRVRSVSQSLSQEVEQVVSGARREMPRLAEASLENVQAFGAGIARWSQGLFGAAARALGDDPASRSGTGGDALRTSLRNRGGIRVASRGSGRAAAELGAVSPAADVTAAMSSGRRAREEEAVDPFLLDDLPEEQVAGAQAASEPVSDNVEAEEATFEGAFADAPVTVAVEVAVEPGLTADSDVAVNSWQLAGSAETEDAPSSSESANADDPAEITDQPNEGRGVASSWQLAGSAETENAPCSADLANVDDPAEVNVNIEEQATAASDSEWQML